MFYLSAELRRAACWGIAGGLFLAPVAWYVFAHVQQRGIVDQICGVAILLLGSVWLSQYLLPRMRVDKQGIRRRLLWMWDLWTWDEFASGTVRGGFYANQFVSVDRPWWRRKLTLGFLESQDEMAIGDLIRRIWVPPNAEPIPERLTIRLKWPDRRCLHLSQNGLETEKRQERQSYEWKDVTSLTIWRAEPGRHDFRELELVLPDQKVKLVRREADGGGEWNNWINYSSEQVGTAMCQFLDVDCIRDFALKGQAKNLEELEARYTRKMVAQEEALTCMKWCCRIMWGLVAIMPLLFPWPNWLSMGLMTALLGISGQWLYRDTKRTAEELQRAFEVERMTHSRPSPH